MVDFPDKLENEYRDAKAKFYQRPVLAAQIGIVVGILGTLLVQAIF